LSICMEPCAKPLVRSGTGSRRASVRRSMHLNNDPFSCATSTAFLAWAQYKLIHLTAWLLRSSWLIFDHNRPLQHVGIPPNEWLLDSTNTTHLLTTSLSRVPHVASHEISNCRYKRQYELVSHSLITCFYLFQAFPSSNFARFTHSCSASSRTVHCILARSSWYGSLSSLFAGTSSLDRTA
jgi:hypothetical protein